MPHSTLIKLTIPC